MALLDPEAKALDDAVERPIAKGGGPRDPMEDEASTRAAIESGMERLGLSGTMPLLVGVTIGFPHCGVGSGPALRDWLADLSAELGEPLVFVGDHGVSYAPAHCVEFVRRIFEPLPLHLDRIELAPVAASRMLESLRSGAVTLGSGVSWSARILDRDVLEAFEIVDGAFDEILHVVSNGIASPIQHLEGVYVDEELCRNRGLSLGMMAPAVGVAVALPDAPRSNLLDGHLVGGPVSRISGPIPRVESRLAPEPALPRQDRPAPDPRWEHSEEFAAGDYRPAENRAPAPRARGNGWDGQEGGEFGYERPYPDETTYQLRRQPGPDEWNREPLPPEEARQRAVSALHPRRDDLAGIESFSPQPTGLDSRSGYRVSDFLLGALLMLTLVLVAALVLL
jgi:hypothetical protein